MSEFYINIDQSEKYAAELADHCHKLNKLEHDLNILYKEIRNCMKGCINTKKIADLQKIIDEDKRRMEKLKSSYQNIIIRYLQSEKTVVDQPGAGKTIYDKETQNTETQNTGKKSRYDDFNSTDQELIDSIKNSLSWKYEYSYLRWFFHPEQRELMTSQLIIHLAGIYGVEITEIEISEEQDPEEGYITYGYYSNGKIWINKELTGTAISYDDMLHTVLHELRHAYQDKISHSEYADYDEETLKEWRNVFIDDNYITPTNDEGVIDEEQFEKYDNQPVEQDADAFADQIQKSDRYIYW